LVPIGRVYGRNEKLPAVLSGEEVNRLLSCVKCHKHRTFLLLQYAAGMRLSEVSHLKISDLDSQRMQLRIEFGKGQKTNETGGMRLEPEGQTGGGGGENSQE